MVRARSPAGLLDADIVVTADIADNGKRGTAIGRYGEKRNAGIERDRCERFSGEAACRYSRGQAHYTLRRKAAKLHLGITNGLRPAFGESPPFVPAGLIGAKQPKAYPILFCVCLASGQIAGITGTEWNEICISSSAGW